MTDTLDEPLKSTFFYLDRPYIIIDKSLTPDTLYYFQIKAKYNNEIYLSTIIDVYTQPEILFTFDRNACSDHLSLINDLTVVNKCKKKWSTVRATNYFNSGIHYWEVSIDKCTLKNVFIGVMSRNGTLYNYLGSDEYGWGYIANKAIWHNRGRLKYYGEVFREGDRIGVTLNMEIGTLSFSRYLLFYIL